MKCLHSLNVCSALLSLYSRTLFVRTLNQYVESNFFYVQTCLAIKADLDFLKTHFCSHAVDLFTFFISGWIEPVLICYLRTSACIQKEKKSSVSFFKFHLLRLIFALLQFWLRGKMDKKWGFWCVTTVTSCKQTRDIAALWSHLNHRTHHDVPYVQDL